MPPLYYDSQQSRCQAPANGDDAVHQGFPQLKVIDLQEKDFTCNLRDESTNTIVARLMLEERGLELHYSRQQQHQHQQQQQSMRSKQKKKARFSRNVTIFPTIHLLEYTPEENAATWFTKQDFRNFRKERRHTIAEVERGNILSSNNRLCFRGLETKTHEGAIQKRSNVVDSWIAVMDEQEFQDKGGYADPTRLAQTYAKYNHRCQSAAQYRALDDSIAAQGYRPHLTFPSR